MSSNITLSAFYPHVMEWGGGDRVFAPPEPTMDVLVNVTVHDFIKRWMPLFRDALKHDLRQLQYQSEDLDELTEKQSDVLTNVILLLASTGADIELRPSR
jgi:hypothetical protein